MIGPFNLQIAGFDSRFKVDGFVLRQSLEPRIHAWHITVDHEVAAAVEALAPHTRRYWMRDSDEVMIVSGAAMIGWDALDKGDRFYVSIHGDVFEEDEDESDDQSDDPGGAVPDTSRRLGSAMAVPTGLAVPPRGQRGPRSRR